MGVGRSVSLVVSSRALASKGPCPAPGGIGGGVLAVGGKGVVCLRLAASPHERRPGEVDRPSTDQGEGGAHVDQGTCELLSAFEISDVFGDGAGVCERLVRMQGMSGGAVVE